MKNNLKNIIFVSIAMTCFGCQQECTAQTPIKEVRLANKKIVLILDSISASESIIHDQIDGFFDKVTASEMSIQMKRPLEGKSREALLPYYMGFLQTDVADFDYKESKFVAELITKIHSTCGEVNPDIFPDTLKLIKTKGRHYGDGVWYTRENCIIIPANELATRKTNPFTSTLFHETFHVYSRLNPVKSAALYGLIGFQAFGYNNLQIPPALKERVLYNPDGVDFAQRIALAQEDGTTVHAIPVIFSNSVGYEPGRDEFFGYVEFNLYQIMDNLDGTWSVITKEDGWSSTLNIDGQTDFFRQIKDNTGYIIHPDEVLADNFSFIMIGKKTPSLSAKFSPPGKELLKNIEKILEAK